MRVALLTSYPADHASFEGGVQTATAALVEGLAQTGEVELHVVSSSDLPEDAEETRDGVGYHFLSAPSVRPRFPGRVAKARRALKAISPDVVHCQDTLVLALAGARGPWAKLFSIHGVKRAEVRLRTGWERPSALFEAALERFVHRAYDAVVCNSSYAARSAGASVRKFEVPNAVASEFFSVRRAGTPRPRLLFVGALAPLKGPHDLVAAHAALRAEHPDLVTSLCGPEEDRAYAAALKRDAGPGVAWEGLVSRPRMLELFEDAAAVVLPSRQENVPMVVAEAMAAGVPVVATRVGGVPEMVDDGVTGLLFDPGDVTTLTRHAGKLLADPALGARLAAAAKASAEARYSTSSVASATLAVYRELVA